MNHNEILNELNKWSDFVFKDEEKFLKRFGKGDFWEVMAVYWNEDMMNIYYLLQCGQHITDSFPIEEWLEYYNQKT